jgi:hypothetical protein
MKIYEFPQKNNSPHDKTCKAPQVKNLGQRPTKAKNSDSKVLDEILAEVKETILQEGWEDDVDVSKINQEMLFNYLDLFPCFKSCHDLLLRKDFDTLFSLYDAQELSCEQEVVFELLLELMSPYDFGFTIADMFLVLDKKDRQPAIQVLSEFSEMV